ncbi:hypothetical protein OG256_44550 (plasmid) [Streptomyces sp. NBC_00564]|nr:hypothetical protein OG256_44550 [Streptomyces sp. NBC_00564]
MTRTDIAAFLVSQLTDTRYRRAMSPGGRSARGARPHIGRGADGRGGGSPGRLEILRSDRPQQFELLACVGALGRKEGHNLAEVARRSLTCARECRGQSSSGKQVRRAGSVNHRHTMFAARSARRPAVHARVIAARVFCHST